MQTDDNDSDDDNDDDDYDILHIQLNNPKSNWYTWKWQVSITK